MANNISAKVVSIQEKVGRIIRLHEDTKSQNQKLHDEKKELSEMLEERKLELESLQEKNKTIKLAKSLLDTNEDSHEVKLKINEMVREIDKCIAFFNK